MKLPLLPTILLLLLTIGCQGPGETPDSDPAAEEIFSLEHIESIKMPDSTYTSDLNNGKALTFTKTVNGATTTISIRTFEEQALSEDDAFIDFAENYLEDQMKSYEMKSLHFNVAGFKKTLCLQFDGTFRDSTSQDPNKAYLAHEGYLCKVPGTETKIAEIKVVHRSADRLMPNAIIYDFQVLIEQLQFTEE